MSRASRGVGAEAAADHQARQRAPPGHVPGLLAPTPGILSVPSPALYTFDYYSYIPCSWVKWFFYKIVLTLLVPLPFHVNFRIISLISTKSLAGIFIGIMLNIDINWRELIFFYIESSSPWIWHVSIASDFFWSVFYSFQHIIPILVLRDLCLSLFHLLSNYKL